MLASPFLQLIVKFVSRQVEKLPSLKSKSYSFRGAKPNLSSVQFIGLILTSRPAQHIPATAHFVVSISALASSLHRLFENFSRFFRPLLPGQSIITISVPWID